MVYNTFMSTGYIYEPIFLDHNDSSHPEKATRLTVIMDYLKEHNLIEGLKKIPCRKATDEELRLGHTPEMIRKVREAAKGPLTYIDPDTYITPASCDAAITAAGGFLNLIDALLDGKIQNGAALTRPPGHHATHTTSMGFCLFNTIAIGAKYCVTQKKLPRIAIVDFDVHHGNGTENIVDTDSRILYASSHGKRVFPGTGPYYFTGKAGDEKNILNMPLPPGAGDNCHMKLYREIAFPVIEAFRPQLILVSAGFDGHRKDPLADCALTSRGYYTLCKELIELAGRLCGGKILFNLEGGYNLNVIPHLTGNLFRLLTNKDKPHLPVEVLPKNEPDISMLMEQIKKVWF